MIKIRHILFITIIVGFSACTKDLSDNFRPYPNNQLNDTIWSRNISANAPINELLDSTLTPPYIDSFLIGTRDTIRLSNNVEIIISPSSIVAVGGGTIPVTGFVKIEFQYFIKKGDFIKTLKHTTSYNSLLEFSGQFFLRLSKNGQELAVSPYSNIKIKFPDTEDNPKTNMSVFKGWEYNTWPSPQKDTMFTWQKTNDGSTVGTWYKTGTGPNNKGYEITTKNLRWVACGRFIDSTKPKNKLTAILPPNFTNKNTVVYTILENTKTVAELKSDYNSRSFAALNIPLNTKLNIVTISKIGNNFYYGIRNINDIGNTAIFSISPEKKSLSYILSELDKL